jgi:catechol 2,3-dioxygenase-like lactoylglutathione lyase family enzyme
MPLIKITDMAYARLASPDLDAAEEFLTDFGLVRSARTRDTLYMRGSDPPHHLHVTHKGEPKFIGFAYYAANEEDLARVATAPGASGVEHLDEPGGGKRVRLTEPNGYQIEVVYGIEELPALPVPRQPTNSGAEPLRRAGVLMRPPKGLSLVKRIAHGVMATPKLDETVAWFRNTLGFIGSDDLYMGSPDHIIGSFSRADCGDEYVDHHIFFCIRGDKVGLNHISFEVPDIDAVFMHHEYLKSRGKYEHMWGIGRHLLGSQVYDYWADPWGRVHERWADTDRLNAKNGSNVIPAHEGFASQWGEPPPPKMIGRVSP